MVWNDAQSQLECTMLGKEVGRTSKGLVGTRPITIIVTIGSIYGESRIMPEWLRRECILQSNTQRSQQCWDWPSSAQRIIDRHENSWRLFVTLFATDKCSYSYREERASHPFVARGIRGNKLLVESSEQTIVQGQRGCPLRRSWGQRWEEYLVIWNGYVAREHPDAEYKYRGVFVAIIHHQARRRDLNNIYTLNTFIAYPHSYYFVSLDVFSIPLSARA